MQSFYCYFQVCETNESGLEEITCRTKPKDQYLMGCTLDFFNLVFSPGLENFKKRFGIK